jgi:hypothetical protein
MGWRYLADSMGPHWGVGVGVGVSVVSGGWGRNVWGDTVKDKMIWIRSSRSIYHHLGQGSFTVPFPGVQKTRFGLDEHAL